MRFDRRQARWCFATAVLGSACVIVHQILARRAAEPLTGGSLVGLTYGIISAALLVWAGLLAAHRKLLRWTWIGRRSRWLRAHVWIGLLSFVTVLCHSNFGRGGPFTTALWVVYLVVLVTGIFGIVVQVLIPRLITMGVPCEAPYEQIPQLCRMMLQEADQLVDQLCAPRSGATATEKTVGTTAALNYSGNAFAQLRDFHETCLRPFLTSRTPRRSPLSTEAQSEAHFAKLRSLGGLSGHTKEIDRLAALSEQRRLLCEQERLHVWLHSWLLIHVPASALLLVLGAWHVVTALYY